MTATTEFQALLAEEHAAVADVDANGVNDANEARLDAASRALLAARPTDLHDMAKLLRWVRDTPEWDDHAGVAELVAQRLEA